MKECPTRSATGFPPCLRISSATTQQTQAYNEITETMESINVAFSDIESSAADIVKEMEGVNQLVTYQLAKLDKFEHGDNGTSGH